MKNTYVMTDWTARECNPGHGFCNTKQVVVCRSKSTALDYLAERECFDYSAEIISRTDALSIRTTHQNDILGGFSPDGVFIEFGPQRY